MFGSNMKTQTLTQISEDIFPSEAHALIAKNRNNGDLIILDVCTPKEFAKLHLKNAINLNYFSRSFRNQLNGLDKSKPYLVYCKVGGRSKLAQKSMKKLGFREVYNVVGGTLLWARERLPFAPGFESPPKFSLCPIFLTMIFMKMVRNLHRRGYQALLKVVSTGGSLSKNLRYRLGG